MLYQIYQAQADFVDPLRTIARNTSRLLRIVTPQTPYGIFLRHFNAALEVFGHSGTSHQRPSYRIKGVPIGNSLVPVTEEVVHSTPFANLLHFKKDSDRKQPKVLVVAPLSGHFSTLLRHTIEVLLRDHDVFVTDWANARDVPVSAGRFGFDEYVEHVIDFIRVLGPRSHIVGVCQPTVAVLAAVSVMAEEDDAATPRSMTLMAGPIDTRRNPTHVNVLAKTKKIDWFEEKMIGIVPWRYKGGGRRVYPGFMQLTAFVSMNLDKHISAHMRQYRNLAVQDGSSAEAHRNFYDEYLAVMDLPAEFYLETVEKIFMQHQLAVGELTYKGKPVRPSAIRKTFLFTVEGERDDICGLGQTAAALDLCSNLRPVLKRHHVQTGVGHYGVFSGRRWENEIYPLVREVIQFSA
ncbi:polyhydroxyalkanoate depolymerase [Acidocella aminolytica]|jgi:poly(3-hydroxybutyrate) depolymerase|uniref:Polyhydroxyalkanoate depolymerase n=1 Tax=Acidocella aminolytica 101 = DSM 11237 TaxID=1120923 RepID=A0A0D6PD79_9PROT|nr:polyhydroxyalkanoate depolymerase [Acidocella aminolytica]GAN79316.1 polyhydroxyalkanoate depolymerase [Acidocella aminolytica 101 = DSM 11237]GBQ39551.1 poly-beta-hydroxyalkanoate depolymerase [Acidocella aminolytica 101 = DSM 11237]SHE38213.1 poly(3-hydroxybutyrate) depolymerase [Acidocella aminolytica 101 = DSM 11237]